jgi:hypothetical protein
VGTNHKYQIISGLSELMARLTRSNSCHLCSHVQFSVRTIPRVTERATPFDTVGFHGWLALIVTLPTADN